jgi:hypothetical protein
VLADLRASHACSRKIAPDRRQCRRALVGLQSRSTTMGGASKERFGLRWHRVGPNRCHRPQRRFGWTDRRGAHDRTKNLRRFAKRKRRYLFRSRPGLPSGCPEVTTRVQSGLQAPGDEVASLRGVRLVRFGEKQRHCRSSVQPGSLDRALRARADRRSVQSSTALTPWSSGVSSRSA